MRAGWLGLVSLAACVLAGSGCGSESSDEEKAAAAVQTYLSAVAEGDGDSACEQLSGNGQRELIGFVNRQLPQVGTIECAKVVSTLNGAMGPDEEALLRDAEVTTVEIDGDSATATVEGANVRPTLIKSGDDWLIETGFEGP